MNKARLELLSLLRAVPMTAMEASRIVGYFPQHAARVLNELEAQGYVIRYGYFMASSNKAAVWHWTGKDFGTPITGSRMDAMQVEALKLPDQMQRYALGVEIALRLDGLADRTAA